MKILFWDFDGTLVHSGPLWSNSVYAALKTVDANTTVAFEALRKHMSYGFTWHNPNEDFTNVKNDAWWDFMNRHLYNSYIKCGVEPKIALKSVTKIHTIIKQKNNYTLYDDTIRVLNELKQNGYINVLLTNNYPDLNDVIDLLNLSTYFDRTIISGQVGYDKPRKEIFEIAKSSYPDSQYFMIGDNIEADIIGAQKCGITSILVHRGYSETADYCFDSLNDVKNFLQQTTL